jgi:hypothetical protein
MIPEVKDTFPDLLDAGADDLMKGLKQKHFTSVDLVKVLNDPLGLGNVT